MPGKNEKVADLHVHTRASDGTFSPAEVVKCAKDLGISAIAITDHDCIDGIQPTIDAAKGTDLEIIPGVELTSEMNDCEMHILGYYICWKENWFVERLNHLCQLRIKRMEKMLERLLRFGIKVNIEEVLEVSGEGSLGRLHLARVLLDRGFVKSLQEAFSKFIGNGKPCYIKGYRITPIEAITMICRVNGIPVLAHPYVMGKDEFIPDLAKAGLQGIEAYHTDHPNGIAQHYEEIARQHGLLVTGGSDCHGFGKGHILMGKIAVPYEVVEKLRQIKNVK